MKQAFVLFAALLVVAGMKPVHGRDRIELRVTPSVAKAPGFVKVRVFINQDAGNRAVEVVADSPDFYRSSLIPMNGERAPLATEIQLRDLPGGQYNVSAVLHGLDGVRGIVHQTVVIVPPAGLPER